MKHLTLLDGLKFDAEPRSSVLAPTLLKYDLARDTVENFYNDLRQPNWLSKLEVRSRLTTRDGQPLVDQHVHKKAVLVVVDATCLAPGFPRLDPARVVSAGFVIRRESRNGSSNSGSSGSDANVWAQDSTGTPLGWIAAPADSTSAASRFEPDSKLRLKKLVHTNPALRLKTRLTGDVDGISETVHTLFAIPPDLAKSIGRSLYFSILPTTSFSVIPATPPPPPFSHDDIQARVPNLLRYQRDNAALPSTNTSISSDDYRDSSSDSIQALRNTIDWLARETGFFTPETYAVPLRSALADVPVSHDEFTNLRDWLDQANRVLSERRVESGSSITTPASWPAIDESRFDTITEAAVDALSVRWNTLAPTVNRFGDLDARYHVRCFVRVDDEPACPPQILWSPLSRSYSIRPWFESAGAPPQQITLPPINANTLRNLKPDVAVLVPPQLQRIMDRLNVNDLLEGKKKENPNISLGMICGFSIPIITVCAFIILQIFLALLNIIFFWLPYVRICIPFPTVSNEEEGG